MCVLCVVKGMIPVCTTKRSKDKIGRLKILGKLIFNLPNLSRLDASILFMSVPEQKAWNLLQSNILECSNLVRRKIQKIHFEFKERD